MLANEIHGFLGLRQRTIGKAAGVERLVGDRTGVVAHAAVDGDIGTYPGDCLASSNAIKRDPSSGD